MCCNTPNQTLHHQHALQYVAEHVVEYVVHHVACPIVQCVLQNVVHRVLLTCHTCSFFMLYLLVPCSVAQQIYTRLGCASTSAIPEKAILFTCSDGRGVVKLDDTRKANDF